MNFVPRVIYTMTPEPNLALRPRRAECPGSGYDHARGPTRRRLPLSGDAAVAAGPGRAGVNTGSADDRQRDRGVRRALEALGLNRAVIANHLGERTLVLARRHLDAGDDTVPDDALPDRKLVGRMWTLGLLLAPAGARARAQR
jgi:hypothetical protein